MVIDYKQVPKINCKSSITQCVKCYFLWKLLQQHLLFANNHLIAYNFHIIDLLHEKKRFFHTLFFNYFN